ncbi:unnamed protein product, partial [marine sediment metagenome]
YFYSDKDPEETSVDGRAYHQLWDGLFWPELLAAPGNYSDDWIGNLAMRMYGSRTRDKFYQNTRAPLLFDTSIILPGAA